MTIPRIPYVTLIIVVLNVIVYFAGVSAEAPYKAAVQAEERDLVGYYTQHPNLELPPETFEKLSPGSQQMIGLSRSKTLKVGETMEKVDEKLTLMEHFLNADDPAEPPKEDDPETMQAILEAERKRRQAELDRLVQEFEATLEKSVYKDFGFIPASGSLKTMITALFLHKHFFVLLMHMLLLLGLGYALEGAWRSIAFPIVYLSGGLFAMLAYQLSASHSATPLLGAGGAIAVLAGAFAVRSYDAENAGISLAKGATACVLAFITLFGLRASTGAMAAGDLVGGGLFGVIVALVFRLNAFERNVLMPEEERQAERANLHLGRAMAMLDEEKYAEAIEELKKAAEAEPENSLIAKELCKAYARKGQRNQAARKCKQVIALQLKRDMLAEAVDDYIELSDLVPDIVLDARQHLTVVNALEERARQVEQERLPAEKKAHKQQQLFTKAAAAYRNFVTRQQRAAKTLEAPATLDALQRYADICAHHLDRPQDAYKAYQLLLNSSHVSQERKETLKASIQQLRQRLSTASQSNESPPPQGKAASQPNAVKQSAVSRPNIPLQKRIKLVQETTGNAPYPVQSVAPLSAKQVVPAPDGLDLKRGPAASVRFQDIYALLVAYLPEEQEDVKAHQQGRQSAAHMLVADLFLRGQSRPFRLRSDRIAYPQFLAKPRQKSVENFHQFVLHLIQHVEGIYLDQGTFEFLKSGKIPQFPNQQAVETHERNLWQQLAGLTRFHCDKCWEVYWVDSRKIPPNGGNTTCAKCGHAIFVRQET